MLNDRPPDVRILRPAGDKKVSPLEEVPIEARADDDYGVRSLELVIKSAGGKEKIVSVGAAHRATRVGDRRCTRVPRGSQRQARRRRHLLRAGGGCRARAALGRIAQRHLLPRGQTLRRGVRRGRRPVRAGRRAGDRARRPDRAAERHHGRDLEDRRAGAARRRRRAVVAGHQGDRAGAGRPEEQGRRSRGVPGRRQRRSTPPAGTAGTRPDAARRRSAAEGGRCDGPRRRQSSSACACRPRCRTKSRRWRNC